MKILHDLEITARDIERRRELDSITGQVPQTKGELLGCISVVAQIETQDVCKTGREYEIGFTDPQNEEGVRYLKLGTAAQMFGGYAKLRAGLCEATGGLASFLDVTNRQLHIWITWVIAAGEYP